MASKTKRALYRKLFSFCKGKRVNPNKCENIRYCKVAKGKRRTYCRKKKATRYTKRKPPIV